MVLQVESEEQFKQIVNDSGEEKHEKKYVVVDFYADWCGPCKRFAPTFKELSEKYGKSIQFVKVNIDDVEELSDTYNIRALPTFMFFDVGSTESNYESVVGVNQDKIEQRLKYFEGKTSNDNDF